MLKGDSVTRSPPSRSAFATSQLIRHRLPRGIAVLLLIAVVVVVGTAYVYLRSALLANAADRAHRAAARLAATLTQSARQTGVEMTRAVADTSIQRALQSKNSEADSAIRHAVERVLRARVVSSVIAERLLDVDHHEVATAGRWPAGVSPAPLDAEQPRDSAPDIRISRLQLVSDTLYYAATLRVQVAGATRGWLEESRRIAGGGGAQAFIDLIGPGAGFLVGNTDGKTWTDLTGPALGPTLDATSPSVLEYRAQDGTKRIGSEVAVARTPWVAWVDFPTDVILAPAYRFLLVIGALGLAVILVGGVGAWRLSKRIVGPLEEVSRAAEGIAAGDLSQRVVSRRRDELGVLADSFNSMASQVEEAHQTLEHRVAVRTAEVEAAVVELHAAQEELVRKERLATLGQLAGSVGHELRNPLGVMTNSLYLLGMIAPNDPPLLREYLGIIKGQVSLSEKIVGDLLDFARVKEPTTEAFDLGAIVSEQIERAGADPQITVRRESEPGLPLVRADRTQVSQIVLNLFTNAVQAVGDKSGSVTLRSRGDGNGRLFLDVTDTGCGIPTANLGLIFDPLFTTKARGIGLGLSVSRQLARANGGDIRVASTVGIGSTFSLELPAAIAAS